jgi:hypothetical protein
MAVTTPPSGTPRLSVCAPLPKSCGAQSWTPPQPILNGDGWRGCRSWRSLRPISAAVGTSGLPHAVERAFGNPAFDLRCDQGLGVCVSVGAGDDAHARCTVGRLEHFDRAALGQASVCTLPVLSAGHEGVGFVCIEWHRGIRDCEESRLGCCGWRCGLHVRGRARNDAQECQAEDEFHNEHRRNETHTDA